MHRPPRPGNLAREGPFGANAIRIHVRKLKGLLWFVGLVAFLAAGWTFWDIVQGKKQGRFTPRPPAHFQDLIWRDVGDGESGIAGPAFYDQEAYESTWLARIDGSVKPVPVTRDATVSAEPTKVQIEPITDVLEVSLVVYSENPMRRFVAIEYTKDAGRGATGSKTKRLHLTEGEPLRAPYDGTNYNGEVIKISKQTVTFRWGEEDVVVTPSLGRDGNDVTADDFRIDAVDDPASDYDKAPGESIQLDNGEWVLGLKDRDELSNNTDQVLADLSVRTVTPTGGGHSYLELTVKAGTLPDKYGFQTGDRIISVNGIPMPSKSAALNWAKNNADLGQYLVVYERLGKVQSQTIHWKGN